MHVDADKQHILVRMHGMCEPNNSPGLAFHGGMFLLWLAGTGVVAILANNINALGLPLSR